MLESAEWEHVYASSVAKLATLLENVHKQVRVGGSWVTGKH
jgi:hypothetical protein